jgi:hypothetical protein
VRYIPYWKLGGNTIRNKEIIAEGKEETVMLQQYSSNV